jgi:hypothetical protein
MPRAAKEQTIDPEALYVCWMSGSVQVNGQDISFQRGTRLRGDSPLVRATPQFWVDGRQ